MFANFLHDRVLEDEGLIRNLLNREQYLEAANKQIGFENQPELMHLIRNNFLEMTKKICN